MHNIKARNKERFPTAFIGPILCYMKGIVPKKHYSFFFPRVIGLYVMQHSDYMGRIRGKIPILRLGSVHVTRQLKVVV